MYAFSLFAGTSNALNFGAIADFTSQSFSFMIFLSIFIFGSSSFWEKFHIIWPFVVSISVVTFYGRFSPFNVVFTPRPHPILPFRLSTKNVNITTLYSKVDFTMRRIQLSDSGPVFLPPSPLARPSKFGTSHWLPPTTPVVDWRRTGSTCKSGLGATASSISAAFPYPNRIFAFHAVASCCLSGSSLPARPSSSFSGRKEWNFLILCDRSVGRFAVYFMRAFSPSVPMHRIFSFGMLRSDLVKAFSMALYTSLCLLVCLSLSLSLSVVSFSRLFIIHILYSHCYLEEL